MCGIFGSTNFKTFNILYNSNKARGNFAHGHLFYNDNKYVVEKFSGDGTYAKILDTVHSFKYRQYSMFLGHTQSPTGSVRDFNKRTTHPFVSNNWVIGHNGVLNNFKKLIKTHAPEHENMVDSSIIPVLLENASNTSDTDSVVKNVLELLSGTYALFIFNIITKELYIARSGSTLFISSDTPEFSSVKIDNMQTVVDNTIYKLQNNKFVQIDQLKNRSSFITF